MQEIIKKVFDGVVEFVGKLKAKLVETFTDLYYGPEAGAAIRRYRDLLGEAADQAGASVRWFPNLSDYAFLDASRVGAFYALRDEARKNGIQDMTLEEINQEISKARAERKKKQ